MPVSSIPSRGLRAPLFKFLGGRGPTFIILLQFGVFVMCCPFGIRGYADFRQLYTAAWMVRAGYGSQLYNYDLQWELQRTLVGNVVAPLPFNHLSYEALFLAPLSIVSYRIAYVVAGVVNLLLLAYVLRKLALRLREFFADSRAMPLPMLLGTIPMAIALVQGQDSIVMLALLMAAWFALDSGKDFRAGALVALMLFKFQFALPIALLFLIWRRWRFVGGFSLVAAGILAVSVWVTGKQGFIEYAHMLISMSAGLRTAADRDKYQILPWMMPNLRGLSYLLLPQRILHVATALASLAVVVYAATRKAGLPLAVLVAMLVSYHGLIHDACILILPLAALLAVQNSSAAIVLAKAALVAPAALFPLGQLYCLMTVPLLALLPLEFGSLQTGAVQGDAFVESPKISGGST
jgi:hypothetical protein